MSADAPRSRKERVLELMRANRLAEAAALCDEVTRNENNAGAWHLLGVIQGMQGNLREAERCSREAIRLHPGYVDAYCNLGTALRTQGRFDEAIPALRQALVLQPNHVEARYNLGLALAEDKRLDEAIDALRETILLKPDHLEARLHLGVAFASVGRLKEAVESFREVAALDQNQVSAHLYLGNACVDLGTLEEAVASYRAALQRQPCHLETLNNLGNALSELGRKDEAIVIYRKSLECDPQLLVSYHNLGHTLIDLGRASEAIDLYQAALRIDPHHPGVLSDLGVALSDQNRHEEAIACYRKALEKESGDSTIHYNLANALWALGRFHDAIKSYQAAIRLHSADADAHTNLGLVYLSLGNFREGWCEYDWQWQRDGSPRRPFPSSPWNDVGLDGDAVFLHDEQGLGDELFFLRFVPWLRSRGAGKIAYRPSAKLASLLTRLPTLDRLAARDERPSESALVFSVGDLPRLLGMERVEQIPPSVTLAPLPAKLVFVRQRLADIGPPPYLGVTWRAGTTKKNALYKEAPRDLLAQLLRNHVPTTVLVLQRHPQPGEIETFQKALGRPVHDLSALNDDLEAMLALLSLIDDYVGVSNTNMHLRAAVGKTAKVLVPAPPEWRWMAEGNESPWFPGFNVYRQGYDGSWDTAFAELATDLKRSLS